MSASTDEKKRRPAAFRLDPSERSDLRRRGAPRIDVADPDDMLPAETDAPVMPTPLRRRGPRWGGLLATAVSGLIVLALGQLTLQFIEDLYARYLWLGRIALALLIIAGIALAGLVLREIVGLMRVHRVERLRAEAERALRHADAALTADVLGRLRTLYRGRPDLTLPLARLAEHDDEVIDPPDRLKLAERELMTPLDAVAERVIADAARRVSVLTAVNPAGVLDVLFVAWQNLAMLRRLATVYGGRAGTIGTFELARMVVTHLAVTGGLALSDSVLQQVIGHGLAGRISARLGEGTVNGVLTARIGLAALPLCRPLPYVAQQRPSLSRMLGKVVGYGRDRESADADKRA